MEQQLPMKPGNLDIRSILGVSDTRGFQRNEGATPKYPRIGEERRQIGNNDGRSIRWSRVPRTGPENRDHEDGSSPTGRSWPTVRGHRYGTTRRRARAGQVFRTEMRVRKLRINWCTYHGTAEH